LTPEWVLIEIVHESFVTSYSSFPILTLEISYLLSSLKSARS